MNTDPVTPGDVAKFHSKDDTDVGIQAHHHTLGIKRSQAASGSHIHDGVSGRKVGEGLGLAINGAKGGNAAIASIITMLQTIISFTDNTTP